MSFPQRTELRGPDGATRSAGQPAKDASHPRVRVCGGGGDPRGGHGRPRGKHVYGILRHSKHRP